MLDLHPTEHAIFSQKISANLMRCQLNSIFMSTILWEQVSNFTCLQKDFIPTKPLRIVAHQNMPLSYAHYKKLGNELEHESEAGESALKTSLFSKVKQEFFYMFVIDISPLKTL